MSQTVLIENCKEASTGCTQKPGQENTSWSLSSRIFLLKKYGFIDYQQPCVLHTCCPKWLSYMQGLQNTYFDIGLIQSPRNRGNFSSTFLTKGTSILDLVFIYALQLSHSIFFSVP